MKSDDWRDLAFCKGQNTNDFYPEFGVKGAMDQVRKMKAFCRRCSVTIECLKFAIANDEQFGIWGGLTPKERTNLWRHNKGNVVETIVKVVRKNDIYEV